MAFTGSGLYKKVKPILDGGSTDLSKFREDMGKAISSYVADNAILEGVYVGETPSGSPSPLTVAVGELVKTAPEPPMLFDPQDPSSPFSTYSKWIKDTLQKTILWNIKATKTHTSSPVLFTPKVSMIDDLGDLSYVCSSYGFWSLICDAIVTSIEAHTSITASGSATDGSSGTITWIPTEPPTSVKHNFVFRVFYDANDLELTRWINRYIADTGDLSGQVNIPIDDRTYQGALTLWKGLIAMTKQCEFYKEQDDGELILFTTGSQPV